MATNYNHLHKAGDFTVSIGDTSQMTLKELRNSIASLPDDTRILVGTYDCGCLLRLTGFEVKRSLDERKTPSDFLLQVSCRQVDS